MTVNDIMDLRSVGSVAWRLTEILFSTPYRHGNIRPPRIPVRETSTTCAPISGWLRRMLAMRDS
jgi:hypothetical protein